MLGEPLVQLPGTGELRLPSRKRFLPRLLQTVSRVVVKPSSYSAFLNQEFVYPIFTSSVGTPHQHASRFCPARVSRPTNALP